MNANNQDAMIRKLLLDALAADWQETLDTAPKATLSARQARRMKAMLRDPWNYAKRLAQPVWKRVVKQVAIILLTTIISLGTLYATNATVRAKVKQWIAELRETDIVYYFFGEREDATLPHYEITALPEGYFSTEGTVELPHYNYIIYANTTGQRIRLEYRFMETGDAHFITTKSMTAYDIVVNNCPGQIFISNELTQGNIILWIDDLAGIQFCVDAYTDKDSLLLLAESVQICSK